MLAGLSMFLSVLFPSPEQQLAMVCELPGLRPVPLVGDQNPFTSAGSPREPPKEDKQASHPSVPLGKQESWLVLLLDSSSQSGLALCGDARS